MGLDMYDFAARSSGVRLSVGARGRFRARVRIVFDQNEAASFRRTAG